MVPWLKPTRASLEAGRSSRASSASRKASRPGCARLTPRQRSCGSRKVRGNHCLPVGAAGQRSGACGATKAASGQPALPLPPDLDQVVPVGAVAVQEGNELPRPAGSGRQAGSGEGRHRGSFAGRPGGRRAGAGSSPHLKRAPPGGSRPAGGIDRCAPRASPSQGPPRERARLPIRPEPERAPASGACLFGSPQRRSRPPDGRPPAPAHRGYRPRPLPAGLRGGDRPATSPGSASPGRRRPPAIGAFCRLSPRRRRPAARGLLYPCFCSRKTVAAAVAPTRPTRAGPGRGTRTARLSIPALPDASAASRDSNASPPASRMPGASIRRGP